MPIRAILFDKDGTLVDFNRTWGPAVQAVLEELACGSEKLYRELATATGLVNGVRFLPGSPVIDQPTTVFATSWAIILGRPAEPALFAEIDRRLRQATMAHLTAVGDPKTVLPRLAGQGYRLGLITNDSEATARAHARALGLDHVLEFVAGYDSGFGAKPEPGLVFAFAAAAGVSTNEIVVVGDSPLDVATARNAGVRAVVVLTGPQSPVWLVGVKPDAIIASIMEVPAWLETARVGE